MRIIEAVTKYAQHRQHELCKHNRKSETANVLQFAAFWRDPRVCEITLEQINEWLEWQKRIGNDDNTIFRKTNSLKQFFKFYFKQGIAKVDPDIFPKVDYQFKFPKIAERADYDKFFNAIAGNDPWRVRDRALVKMLEHTGARIGELLALNVDDLDDDQMGAIIKTEKSRGRRPFRRIFWREECKALLSIYLHSREDDNGPALWISNKKGRLNYYTVQHNFKRYSLLAGLNYTINAHSLRHLFGRELVMKGCDNSEISTFLGHSDLSSSYQYTQLFGDRARGEYYRIFGK